MKWFTINIANCPLLFPRSLHFWSKIHFPFWFQILIKLFCTLKWLNMFLLWKPHKVFTTFTTTVVKGFRIIGNRKLFTFFVLWKTTFFNFFFSSVSLTFLFEFDIFSNDILETEHSHLSNGSLLISQTVHFYSPTHFTFIWWKLYFPFEIHAELCFFNFSTFEINMFSNKIPEAKHSHLRNG